MITFLNGLGPPFEEVERLFNAKGVVFQHLDHVIQRKDGTTVQMVCMHRGSDQRCLTIQFFPPDKRIAHHLLWGWCEEFGLDAGEMFGIYRV